MVSSFDDLQPSSRLFWFKGTLITLNNMKLSFIDESGISDESKFFILGTMVIDESISAELKQGLFEIKAKNGIPANLEIKWNRGKFNGLMRKSGLEAFDEARHRELKNEILLLIKSQNPENLNFVWYLSPLMFFNTDHWRSYHFSFNDTFNFLSEDFEKLKQNTIALIDTIGEHGIDKVSRKDLLKDFVLDIESRCKYPNISIAIPNIDSSLCFGHQINDIAIGILNSYVTQLHSKHHEGISESIVTATKSLKPYVKKLFIKPIDPKSIWLQNLIKSTYNSFRNL